MKSIDLSTVDLNLLVAFLAIYEEQSVTAAAKRLFLGQPAMSAALGRLRSLFEDDLFVRVGRTMQPTRKAQAIAPAIQEILDQVEQVLATSRTFDPATAKREIAIAGSDYASLIIIPKLLAHCATAAPNLDFRLISVEKDNTQATLESGETEIAFGVFPNGLRQTKQTALFQEHLVGIARTGHPAITQGCIDLETFASLSHVLSTQRRDATGYGDRILAKRGLQRRVAVTTPHLLLVPSLVATSDLIAMVPSRIATLHLQQGNIQQFELPFPSEPWSLSILWSSLATADPLNTWLRKTLQTLCANL